MRQLLSAPYILVLRHRRHVYYQSTDYIDCHCGPCPVLASSSPAAREEATARAANLGHSCQSGRKPRGSKKHCTKIGPTAVPNAVHGADIVVNHHVYGLHLWVLISQL
jgi:hypothetical protein